LADFPCLHVLFQDLLFHRHHGYNKLSLLSYKTSYKVDCGVKNGEKAGATAKEAAKVADEVAVKVTRFTIVTTDDIAKFVADSLERTNKRAADAYKNFSRQKSGI
jgi:hypothetical protein